MIYSILIMLTLGCHLLSGCIAAGGRLAAYIAHISNIDSYAADRAKTYVMIRIVKMS